MRTAHQESVVVGTESWDALVRKSHKSREESGFLPGDKTFDEVREILRASGQLFGINATYRFIAQQRIAGNVMVIERFTVKPNARQRTREIRYRLSPPKKA